MTLEDKQIILKTPSKHLVKWYCKLNQWKWPDGLPDPEPEKISQRCTQRRHKIMQFIAKIVGTKAISREWNRTMTDDEFEAFWIENDEEIWQ